MTILNVDQRCGIEPNGLVIFVVSWFVCVQKQDRTFMTVSG